KMNYLFFDEIQHVENFPEVIDSLYIKKNIDIYMTGSNAYMLSSELATLISGRYVEISMLPLSFKEFLQGLGNENELQTKYKQYVQTSSFPYALALQNYPNELRDYLSGIYNTIVIKDVISRKGITDPMILESILQFLFDNMGNPLSTKKIADTMTSGGRKIDVKTVEKYLSALVEAYIVYQVKRYNIKGKQYLKTLDKYYVVDIGLRNMLLGSRSFDVGHVLENIVFLELKRRGFEVYIGKFDDLEVDFVAMNENGRTYYQVAATVRDQGTLKRELASLQKISDHYPKYILTLDEDPDADYEGIKRINVLSWLLDIA
ncbi:MAG: ATP-binding protein, partial [Acetivibrio ethanolgignens]